MASTSTHAHADQIPALSVLVCTRNRAANNESMQRLVLEGPAIPHLALGGGNNMSFKKAVFDKVGMFIESLGPGSRLAHAEDTEFSYRVLWYRCRIIYSPIPMVEHDNW